jgi:putative hydrolases of HD superfamily
MVMDARVDSQLTFLTEASRLALVERRNLLPDGSRRESSAEHSWHAVLAALLLIEHAIEPLDLARLLLLVAIHDLVEVEAGDTFVYGSEGLHDKAEREARAARHLFSLLPDDQHAWLQQAWEEFEQGSSPEARFARVLDRLQPLLLHRVTGGRVWREHGVRLEQVQARVAEIRTWAPALWPWVEELLEEARASGALIGL